MANERVVTIQRARLDGRIPDEGARVATPSVAGSVRGAALLEWPTRRSASPAVLSCPKGVSPQAKQAWAVYVGKLAERGTLRRVNPGALRRLCEDIAFRQELQDGVQKLERAVIDGAPQPRRVECRRLAVAFNAAKLRIKNAEAGFGLGNTEIRPLFADVCKIAVNNAGREARSQQVLHASGNDSGPGGAPNRAALHLIV